MKSIKGFRANGSAVFNTLVLIVLAYGVFLGIQYVPQMIESRTIDSILTAIKQENQTEPARSVQAVDSMIEKHLSVNNMSNMRDHFLVDHMDRDYTIQVSYERKLNLGFEEKTLKYEKTMVLH